MIALLLVTFNPPDTLLSNLEAAAAQVDEVVIVDNGTSLPLLPYTVIRNGKNLGLSGALNIGMEYVEKKGFEWVLMLDQDSRILDTYVTTMLESAAPDVAMIGPRYLDFRSGVDVGPKPMKNGDLPLTMTSGSMLSVKAFKAIGGFNESLFIDYVDTEYCFRLRRMGFRIAASRVVLSHALGDPLYVRLGRYRRTSISHNAGRVYYITRNRWTMIARYARSFPKWALQETIIGLRSPLKIALFEEDKIAKLRMLARGLKDCILRRSGYRVTL